MAENSAGRVALLSIHPEYADAIVNGIKKVEFRRRGLADDVQTVIVYATKPVGKIVASFDVDGIDKDRPTALWRTYQSVGGISRAKFREYFRGARWGYAIRVGEVVPLAEPRSLESFGTSIKPPQSFRYLTADKLSALDRAG